MQEKRYTNDDIDFLIKAMAKIAKESILEEVKTQISEIELKQGEPGKDGKDGKDGLDGENGEAGLTGLNGADGEAGKDGLKGEDGKDGINGSDGSDGSNGVDGVSGSDGLQGADGIAGRDGLTGRDGVKGDNGLNGKDGKSPIHKGLYDSKEEYEAGDITMFNDSSWFKTNSKSQELPGEGWKLLSKQGKTGRKGETGKTGDFAEMDHKVIQDLHDEIFLLKDEIKGLKNAKDS